MHSRPDHARMAERHRDPAADRVMGNWKQFKGYLREKWGDLTDDDVDRLEGRREQLVGYLQERSGREREEVERDIEDITRRSQYAW